jgi:hypothetical protein
VRNNRDILTISGFYFSESYLPPALSRENELSLNVEKGGVASEKGLWIGFERRGILLLE